MTAPRKLTRAQAEAELAKLPAADQAKIRLQVALSRPLPIAAIGRSFPK